MSNIHSWLLEKSPEEIEHFLGDIPRLWLESGNLNKLSLLLSNYEFIEAKITHPEFGIKALIEDYELINDIDLAHPDYSEQTIKSLKLIQGALRLSTHILSQDTTQLAGQLSGRLLDFDTPDIQRLLQQIPHTETTCLRSLRATLTPPTGRLLSTLIGHSDSVNAVVVTPDDTRVISGSSDHTLKVWNLNTAAEIRTLTGHSAPVNAVAVTPDGTRVISGASDNTVRVWNLATGKEIRRFNGHSLPVVAVAVSPDGKKVVSVSIAKINSIKVWDLETGKEELTLKGHKDIVRTVAITSDNRVISTGERGIIKVWDLTNGKMLFMDIHEHKTSNTRNNVQSEPVYAMAVTPDGKSLIDGSGHSDQSTKIIRIWNLETKKKAFTLEGHKNPISALAVTPNGKYVISASFDNTIKVWYLEYRLEILTFIAHDDSIYDIKLTRDGNKIISGSKDKTVKVWNLESQEKHVELKQNKTSVNDVTITPDGKQVIFLLEDTIIKVWLLNKKTIISSFSSTHNYQNNLVIKNRKIFEKYIWHIYSCFTKVFSIFDVPLNNNDFLLLLQLLVLIYLFLSSFFVDWIIVIMTFINIIIISRIIYNHLKITKNNIPKYFYKKLSQQKIKLSKYSKYSDITIKLSQASESNEIIGLGIAPNNLLVCITNQIQSPYQFLTVWNYSTIKRIYDFLSLSQYCYLYLILLISIIYLSSLISLFLYIQFSFPFSSIILELVLFIAFLYVLDKILYYIITFIFNDSATTLSITPDGNYVISGSTNRTIKVWHLETKKLRFVLKGHDNEITSLAVTPDSKYLISGSKDKSIKLWNLETRKECFTLTGHSDSINTLAVTPDGKYVVSGSKDNTIKIWDLEKREEIFTFTGHSDSINRIKVTSNGKLVISASSDKTLQVWDFETREVIATFTGESAINCCAVAPDDVTIVAGDEGGNMHFLRLEGVGSRE
ncbi:WD40 repeat domain-containing protein [Moorena sp. SIO3H5]|uniref:WD40 repeat domain-containing protein n=1 Tax=Moorena sp. SIO3H5 TaxID=2607834 RepID=UPI0013BD965A|nr:WD40 repeat domain-containing protein [Moorena sp. SIO3H5]NEO73146.1 WD40 repeat domain-containing protein [Moorena sp. SIO3H5]